MYKKQDSAICYLKEIHLDRKKIHHTNNEHKKSGLSFLISDEASFKTMGTAKHKEAIM